VREKELGSITNLYVTPVTRLEFLIGKQLPYIAVADGQFYPDAPAGAVRVSGSAQGKLSDTAVGCADLCDHDDRYGMLISRSQIPRFAALFATAILTVLPATQFAGMMTPVSPWPRGQIIGRAFPMTYFVPISVGPSPGLA